MVLKLCLLSYAYQLSNTIMLQVVESYTAPVPVGTHLCIIAYKIRQTFDCIYGKW